uniref:Uncharacterized protein n=1 Tax=Sarcophilus harrisii TaxID=9305 RepID=A0A7N4Q1D1_SARHA
WGRGGGRGRLGLECRAHWGCLGGTCPLQTLLPHLQVLLQPQHARFLQVGFISLRNAPLRLPLALRVHCLVLRSRPREGLRVQGDVVLPVVGELKKPALEGELRGNLAAVHALEGVGPCPAPSPRVSPCSLCPSGLTLRPARPGGPGSSSAACGGGDPPSVGSAGERGMGRPGLVTPGPSLTALALVVVAAQGLQAHSVNLCVLLTDLCVPLPVSRVHVLHLLHPRRPRLLTLTRAVAVEAHELLIVHVAHGEEPRLPEPGPGHGGVEVPHGGRQGRQQKESARRRAHGGEAARALRALLLRVIKGGILHF